MPSATDVFHRQADEVRSIMGDLPIVEARADFIVYVTAQEQKDSKRGDPNKCMFSNACKRAFGSQAVLFYPTVAYVDMLDPNDPARRIVMRFLLPKKTRDRLEAFDIDVEADLTPGIIREATFLLKGVPKSRTLAGQAKAERKRKKRKLVQAPPSPETVERRKESAKRATSPVANRD